MLNYLSNSEHCRFDFSIDSCNLSGEESLSIPQKKIDRGKETALYSGKLYYAVKKNRKRRKGMVLDFHSDFHWVSISGSFEICMTEKVFFF